jgi:hypothetical protein
LEIKNGDADFSFRGTDLACSLGGVLRGAIPILLNQEARLPTDVKPQLAAETPIGARILAVARAYEELQLNNSDEPLSPEESVARLRSGADADFDPDVLNALERLVVQQRELVPA